MLSLLLETMNFQNNHPKKIVKRTVWIERSGTRIVRKPLSGYRIGVCAANENSSAWEEDGADLLRIHHKAPNDSYVSFIEWWGGELERAKRDQVTLVVVKMRRNAASTQYEWLMRKEEDEFGLAESEFSAGNRVLFTTSSMIRSAAKRHFILKDTWGDNVYRNGVA